tara:strand:+ start:555 stop:860 length:306 start_codon:yes stop_codon:yes gene_type:complete
MPVCDYCGKKYVKSHRKCRTRKEDEQRQCDEERKRKEDERRRQKYAYKQKIEKFVERLETEAEAKYEDDPICKDDVIVFLFRQQQKLIKKNKMLKYALETL